LRAMPWRPRPEDRRRWLGRRARCHSVELLVIPAALDRLGKAYLELARTEPSNDALLTSGGSFLPGATHDIWRMRPAAQMHKTGLI
jgi:hypothetical protein